MEWKGWWGGGGGLGVWLTDCGVVEVDEAVEAGRGDPTGGRGVGGRITGELKGGGEEEKKEKEVLESAV